jgi:hypothetical protein
VSTLKPWSRSPGKFFVENKPSFRRIAQVAAETGKDC